MSSDTVIPAGFQALPAQYGSRLAAADVADVQDAIAEEEWAWALQQLTTALILANAAITASERDQLQTLCDAVGLELTMPDALVQPAGEEIQNAAESS